MTAVGSHGCCVIIDARAVRLELSLACVSDNVVARRMYIHQRYDQRLTPCPRGAPRRALAVGQMGTGEDEVSLFLITHLVG